MNKKINNMNLIISRSLAIHTRGGFSVASSSKVNTQKY